MAINVLSISAMSAEAERVFSGARRTISWERSSLQARSVEQSECLKHWIKSNITYGNVVVSDVVIEAAEQLKILEEEVETAAVAIAL